MKKTFLFITSFAIVISVNAQNSSPYWSLAGNSNATSSSKLGTTNGINLRFFTNNAERARITTSGLVGIGTTSPSSKLHINSSLGTDVLKAQANGVTKLLVHNSGGVSVGSGTTPPANGLHVSGNVGIGTASPTSKLHVLGGNIYVQDGGITSLNNTGSYGAFTYGTFAGVYASGPYGVYATGTGTGTNYGVYGVNSTYGIYGSGSFTGVYGTGVTYGVRGNSTGTTGLGGYFYSASYYGIRASTGRTDKNWAGVFDGNVYSYGAYQTSDKNLKKNIEDLADATNIINKLKPRSYEFRKDGKLSSLHLPSGRRYGLLAQELEEVLPNLVMEIDNDIPNTIANKEESKITLPSVPGTDAAPPPVQTGAEVAEQTTEKMTIKSINYIELIPVMIKAMQEQEAKIEALTKLVNQLQQPTLGSSVKLSGISLSQNIPNPPTGKTTRINYNLPSGSATAELVFTNSAGQKIKQIQLNRDGSGFIDINTSSLIAGTYFYTLYVNGKSFATKKMVVAQ